MITENYVSFETAKLLKEKGFESDECIAIYDLGDNNAFIRDGDIFDNGPEDYLEFQWGEEWKRFGYYLAPTLQMAMKWLREVHHYYIQVMLDGWALGDHLGYYVVIQKTDSDFEMMLSDALDEVFYKTPEEAAEAAIKYCLENLI